MPKKYSDEEKAAAIAAGEPPASEDYANDDDWAAAQDMWLAKWTSVDPLPPRTSIRRREEWKNRRRKHDRCMDQVRNDSTIGKKTKKEAKKKGGAAAAAAAASAAAAPPVADEEAAAAADLEAHEEEEEEEEVEAEATAGRPFQVGSRIRALDIFRTRKSCTFWAEAQILAVRATPQGDEYRVHYLGWGTKWEEWLRLDSGRLFAPGTEGSGQLGTEGDRAAYWSLCRDLRAAD